MNQVFHSKPEFLAGEGGETTQSIKPEGREGGMQTSCSEKLFALNLTRSIED